MVQSFRKQKPQRCNLSLADRCRRFEENAGVEACCSAVALVRLQIADEEQVGLVSGDVIDRGRGRRIDIFSVRYGPEKAEKIVAHRRIGSRTSSDPGWNPKTPARMHGGCGIG